MQPRCATPACPWPAIGPLGFCRACALDRVRQLQTELANLGVIERPKCYGGCPTANKLRRALEAEKHSQIMTQRQLRREVAIQRRRNQLIPRLEKMAGRALEAFEMGWRKSDESWERTLGLIASESQSGPQAA